MLKSTFMMIFIMPFCFIMNSFWTVQSLLFLVSFIFIFINYCTNYFVNISYFLGFDVISYGLILLSFWICTLMITSSESINKYDNYGNFFN